jgi:hypothetical protein
MDEPIPTTLTWKDWLFPLVISNTEKRPGYPLLDELKLPNQSGQSIKTAAMNTIHEPDRFPYRVYHFEGMARSMIELLRGLEWLKDTPITSPAMVFYEVNELKQSLHKISLKAESTTKSATIAHTTALSRIIKQGGPEIYIEPESETQDKAVKMDWCIWDEKREHLWIVWEDKSPAVFKNFNEAIIGLTKDAFNGQEVTLQGAKSIVGKVCASHLTQPSSSFSSWRIELWRIETASPSGRSCMVETILSSF